jgi:hypothetical protein
MEDERLTMERRSQEKKIPLLVDSFRISLSRRLLGDVFL